jgi:hypothetical protein
MSRATPIQSVRNRFAKPLPEDWRRHLITLGVPKRKYIAICRATLTDGRSIDPLVVEQGWIISTTRDHMAGEFEQRIDFDPRTITALEVVQVA